MTGSRDEPSDRVHSGIGQGSVSTPTWAPGSSGEEGADPSEGGEHFREQISGDTSPGDRPVNQLPDRDPGRERRGGTDGQSVCARAPDLGPEVDSGLESPAGVESGSCNLESPVRKAVALAGIRLISGDYPGCLLALEAARQLPGSCTPDVERLALICRIHINGEAHAWQKVVELPEGVAAEAKDVQRAFRRLAGLVHPDKCSLPGAEAAFKLLGTAVAHLLGKSGHIGRAAAAGGAEGDSGGVWWDTWQTDSTDEGRKRKRAADTADEAAAAADVEALRGLPVQALEEEVRRRQLVVLAPVRGSEEAALSRQARQLRLRVARTTLSERLAAAAVEGSAAKDGGFL